MWDDLVGGERNWLFVWLCGLVCYCWLCSGFLWGGFDVVWMGIKFEIVVMGVGDQCDFGVLGLIQCQFGWCVGIDQYWCVDLCGFLDQID